MKTTGKIILSILGSAALAAGAAWLGLPALASKTEAYGCFHQVAHKGSGCAALVRKRTGQVVLQLTDFRTSDAADLHVLLISAPDAPENETVKNSERLYVAPLRAAGGDQQYLVPAGPDLAKFNAVVIWNGKYEVNFTTAPLTRPASGSRRFSE